MVAAAGVHMLRRLCSEAVVAGRRPADGRPAQSAAAEADDLRSAADGEPAAGARGARSREGECPPVCRLAVKVGSLGYCAQFGSLGYCAPVRVSGVLCPGSGLRGTVPRAVSGNRMLTNCRGDFHFIQNT